MAALQTMLAPEVLTKVVSQKAAASSWILDKFGLGPGQANEVFEGHGRFGAFNIYNNVRTVAKGKAPGTAYSRSAPNPMGTQPFTYPRMHDSVSLKAEVLHNLGRIDDPTMRDKAGADMIKRQTNTLAQKAANWRKVMLAGCLRDSLYWKQNGESFYFTFTSTGANQISFNMPSGNKSQLNMLGNGNIIATSWDNTSGANIPKQLLGINQAFQQLCGGHLAAVILGYTQWDYVRRNAFVQQEHGTSHSPYLRFERLAFEDQITKTTLNVMIAELASAPGVLFFITDEGFDIGPEGSETFTKIVPDTGAIFIGFEPGAENIQCYLGSEPIAEYDGAPENVKIGMASWSVKRANPTQTDLVILDNSLIVNHVPNSIAFGTVIF